jgi:hypothetical protein
MKPAPRNQEDQLKWALGILAREMNDKIHGKVIVHLENGVIVRSSVEKTEKPPNLCTGKSNT